MKRKKKLGKPLKLTDKQLEELAEITTADIVAAQAAINKYASKRGRNLTMAEVVADA
ncbi:MAG: hypothetical protein GY938_16545 [Ketobacter sp.]|nr:hypothetical protein [Ketobacter sp.]